jgi:hypothetical protein
MTHPIPVRTIGRTAVVGSWVVVLAVAGRPAWLALLLGLVLVGVWVSPMLSSTNRQVVLPTVGPELAVEPGEAGSG